MVGDRPTSCQCFHYSHCSDRAIRPT